MSDTCMDRHWRRRVLLQTLIYWTFIGLCCAGHRPFENGERSRHPRNHDRWAQRIQYPNLHDQGTQRIEYPSINDQGTQGVRHPSVHDRGQTVQYPSLDDSSAGSQIQKCAPGYYRDGSSPYLGRCVPCECNGLSDECEESTGRCLNCQYNTAGDRCERCKEGYYGDAALRTCKACPCPFTAVTKNFAVGCREVYGDIQCICRTGYTGSRCERCAPGYYGDPLVPGRSCRPCNCVGNGNSCDPRTGVCKNALEPGDTNTDDHCQECDNCAQTLLDDLEQLDDELGKIKARLDNATASSSSLDRLKKLEKAISDTKDLVNKFRSAVSKQISRVDQLKEDTDALADDISSLKGKADKRASDADKAVADADRTHKRARELNSEIQKLLKNIIALLDELENQDGRGDTPSGNLAKMLEEAQGMVDEMENKNFTPQKTAAEKERDEAKKLLDYIKGNVSKQCDQNEAAAGVLRGHLEDYEAKLKELDKALKDAVDLLKKANAQNGLNAETIGDMQKRIKDLKNERKTVEDQMALAENELQKTEDLVKMLSDNKTEYEQLAAQLDGAKTDLTKKVNEISKAVAQKDIVEAAEDRAKNLQKIAKDLEDAVKNASGRTEVRDAKDAIEAYKNITDAINAAEAAAKEAKDAADDALDNVKNQNLAQRAKELRDYGNELLTAAEDAEEDLKGIATSLTDLNKRLKDAKNKKKTLEKDLLDAQKQFNDIKRDDIGAMIDSAKQKSASANQTASDTMDRLNEIRKEINKISVSPGSSNLGGILDNVNQSVTNLLETISTLDDKISAVENLTSQFSPISNISENIKMLKDLIEQARDAANMIAIPMMFQGNGYVELHPPKNLDDLKAYTAISLMLQRPEGRGDGKRRRRQAGENDMFVLYLGNRDSSKNYIGMFLRSNELYGVYKLNGAEHTMRTGAITKSKNEPAIFDRVDLNRIYQDAELILTKGTDSSAATFKMGTQGQESENLLDVSPNDIVFYVGGYPANFTPPVSLRYPKYKGCIEISSVNNKDLSLYNFKRRQNINEATPCKRYVKPLDSDFFEGTGFGRVIVNKTQQSSLSMNMYINTRTENGLLLYVRKENDYFIVTIEKGVYYIYSSFLQTPATNNQKVFPTSDWTDVKVILRAKKDFMVYVEGSPVVKFPADFDIQTGFDIYIGGVPLDLRERHNITMRPFRGCLKNLKLEGTSIPLDERVGISKGCSTDTLRSRKAEFTLGSTLSADLADFTLDNDMTVSLGFKSTENEGLILRNKQQANGIDLGMENGYMTLSFNGKMWKSNKQYHDGHWHYVTVTKRSTGIEMIIDDEDKGQEQSSGGSIPDASGSLVLGNENFKGCISNLYTRRPDNLYKAEDLSKFKASGDISLDYCSAFTPVQLMLDHNSKRR